jgi:hypothetical protein
MPLLSACLLLELNRDFNDSLFIKTNIASCSVKLPTIFLFKGVLGIDRIITELSAVN